MNMLQVEASGAILDEDASRFYLWISEVLKRRLDSATDVLTLSRMDRQSRSSANHMRLCRLIGDRAVALKRCVDSPEFLRREILVASAREATGFPSYGVIRCEGIRLREVATGMNCTLLKGWEEAIVILIDLGGYRDARNLGELRPEEIRDLPAFLLQYGRWAAFNYLFGVRDRNATNFVYFANSGSLLSIDNEEGPLDSNGRDIGVTDIINATQQTIQRFIPKDREESMAALRSGFLEGWMMIKIRLGAIDMFRTEELDFIKRRLEADPETVARQVFPQVILV